MSVATVKTNRARPEAASRRVLLSHDDGGGWILSRQDRPACQFSDFEAALASARQGPGSQTATIEVWQSGEYICCLQPDDWPHRPPLREAPIAGNGRGFAAVERYANRAAEVLMPVAGAIFWLALMVVALAASLGWRLALL